MSEGWEDNASINTCDCLLLVALDLQRKPGASTSHAMDSLSTCGSTKLMFIPHSRPQAILATKARGRSKIWFALNHVDAMAMKKDDAAQKVMSPV